MTGYISITASAPPSATQLSFAATPREPWVIGTSFVGVPAFSL